MSQDSSSKALRLNRDSLSKMAKQIKEKLNNAGNVVEVSGALDKEDEPLARLAARLNAKRKRGERDLASAKPSRSSFAARMASRLQQRMRDADLADEPLRAGEPFASPDTRVDSSEITFPSPVPAPTAELPSERLMYSNRRRRGSTDEERPAKFCRSDTSPSP